MNRNSRKDTCIIIGLIIVMFSIIVSCGDDDRSSLLPAIEPETTSSFVATESPSPGAGTSVNPSSDAKTNGDASARDADTQMQNRPAEFGVFGEPQFFADAAQKLGIAVDKFVEALGNPPDIRAAAERLGIPVDEIRGALPEFFQGDFPDRTGGFAEAGSIGGEPGSRLAAAFEEAAGKLDVTVDALMEALGRDFDLEAAAARLETTVEALRAALPEELTGRMEGGFRGQGRGRQ